MFLFAFNLCKQINLFTKHIFANKDITIPYYIYSCFVRSSPLARPDVMPGGEAACRSFTILATLRGKPPPLPAGEAACRPSPSSPLLEQAAAASPGSCLPDQSGRPPSLSGYPSGCPSPPRGHITPRPQARGTHVTPQRGGQSRA